MDALIPADELRGLLERLPLRQVERVRAWCEVCEAFLAAPSAQRAVVAKRLAEVYGAQLGGLSLKSLYAKAARYREQGWRGFVVQRGRPKAEASSLSANGAFLAYWHGLVAANQRVSRRAFDKLVAELRAGVEIPGYGDWRAVRRELRTLRMNRLTLLCAMAAEAARRHNLPLDWELFLKTKVALLGE